MSGGARVVRVCVTGPECTGKTTLARRLAEWAGVSWVPEASRAYAERKGAPLDASDVEPIARAQIAAEDAAVASAVLTSARLLVLDTDLLSTCVYSAYYYGMVPRAVEAAARDRLADLYLLCDIDVPWVADGVRDRPTDRERMLSLFHAALTSRGVTPVIIRGDWDERWARASGAVADVLRL
jgi:HTH-type transcriptional regulator, transcriptional repressor of NAD biosynthesis genes